MAQTINTFAVLTSGGDAPGMNACIRAVVRRSLSRNQRIIGIRRGFVGLLEKEYYEMNVRSVSETISKGGTILQTARCEEFLEDEVQQRAVDNLREMGVDGLIVIGGDGSLKGAAAIAKHGFPVIGIPGTIDRDVACTDYTIGFDTACNTAMEAIDKIRDTSTSHERCSVIEVMGRSAGHIAVWCGLANGAEEVLVPERYDYNEEIIIGHIKEHLANGKQHFIIINAEGVGDSVHMAKRIEAATGMETRATILGYMQRGGNPTCKDRVYASTMGALAVDCLIDGKINKLICYRNGEFVPIDIEEGMKCEKRFNDYQLEICKSFAI